MLFNTLEFAIFFIIVYCIYLLLNHKRQNIFLLAASYFFYAAWNWKFLFLMFFSTAICYTCSIKVYEQTNSKLRKIYLFIAIITDLLILGFFKYYNFFADNIHGFLLLFNVNLESGILKVVLPVGISFYTLQSIGYVIDVYRKEIEPERKFLNFALFISFFPQLVAGPIERAKNLLTQIVNERKPTLNNFYDGSFLIFWGLFQKVFIADNLSKIVEQAFGGTGHYEATQVLIALYAFAFQILCDFEGYSNIARGIAKLMGFNIIVNFNLPYFSTNPKEFWSRWHISLSTWFRDYLYVPLGGNRNGSLLMYRNLLIVMLIGGLWHGAAWTYVIWGIYHAVLLIGHRLLNPYLNILQIKNIILEKIFFIIRVFIFFHLVCVGWLFFRASSLHQALNMLQAIFLNFQLPSHIDFGRTYLTLGMIFLSVQLLQFIKKDQMAVLKLPALVRSIIYFVIYYSIIVYGVTGGKEFIYFQF